MRERTFLNTIFVIAFVASITGLLITLAIGANELVVLFMITTIMVYDDAVSAWIEK